MKNKSLNCAGMKDGGFVATALCFSPSRLPACNQGFLKVTRTKQRNTQSLVACIDISNCSHADT